MKTVAILGAGGIGRHHANWWRVEGAEVVAILGRSDESVARSADKLRGMFGFAGRTFTDLDTLLRETRPAIVDVCTPAPLHFEQARRALQGGHDVLCEKPLVFDPALEHQTLLAQAGELAALAGAGRRLGLCSQFAIAARTCRELLQGVDSAPLRQIAIELRSPVRGRSPDPPQTWIDLGPHLVAALQTLLPGAEPAWDSLRVAASGHNADLEFTLPAADGGDAVAVHLAVGFTTGDPANVRRITLNRAPFDLLGENGPDGLFRMRYRVGDKIDEARPDPMRLLIREYLAGQPSLGPGEALRNQRWLLKFHAACRA